MGAIFSKTTTPPNASDSEKKQQSNPDVTIGKTHRKRPLDSDAQVPVNSSDSNNNQLKKCPRKKYEYDTGVHPEGKGKRTANDVGKTVTKKRETDEDLRGNFYHDVPVQKEYLLRTKRDDQGNLRLDTLGKPLYNDQQFFEKNLNVHLINHHSKNKDKDIKSEKNFYFEKDTLNNNVRGEYSNFLKPDVRKSLRKFTYQFSKTKESLPKFNEELFNNRKLEQIYPIKNKQIKIDVRDQLYLAPLTTVGNLPFRRLCKKLGADITCGEMAVATNILQGKASEWALLRKHSSEDKFGIQITDSNIERISKAIELINDQCDVDFFEINAGCPIDLIYNRGAGCSLMNRSNKLNKMLWTVNQTLDNSVPIGLKMRIGIDSKFPNAHNLIPSLSNSGIDWLTIHGRSRKQRYSKFANWNYIIDDCLPVAKKHNLPLLGNGDIFNWNDCVKYMKHEEFGHLGLTSTMIARGALIKPWLFTEIKERKNWDISSHERFDIYKDFVNFGLDHWGSDGKGVDRTRKFLLEWLSFTHRYVPIGIVEHGFVDKVTMTHRSPFFRGRNDLETLLGSPKSSDWIRITEMLLGKAPDNFKFNPKHKSHAWVDDDSSNVAGGVVTGYS